MATTADLVTKCKIALQIDTTTNDLDDLLSQHILAVNGFMSNAGVSDAQMNSDLGVGVIVLGVNELWNLEGTEAEFSKMFHMLLTQLKFMSMTEGV